MTDNTSTKLSQNFSGAKSVFRDRQKTYDFMLIPCTQNLNYVSQVTRDYPLHMFQYSRLFAISKLCRKCYNESGFLHLYSNIFTYKPSKPTCILSTIYCANFKGRWICVLSLCRVNIIIYIGLWI